MINEKKYQIFVSSTYKDLWQAREKVIETILNLYHFPLGMEMFSADDDEQWAIIQEMLSCTDYYVVIIGHKYGSVTAEGVSYTEKEYDYAVEKGIPVMAFIRNREVALKPSEKESSSKLNRKLDAFIAKATAGKMCNFWDEMDDLATKIAVALPKMFVRKPQIGWIRGSEGVSKELSQELAELSNENRKLREKVRNLESQVVTEKPQLAVTLSPDSATKLVFKDHLKDKDLKALKPMVMDEVADHLQKYVSESDIEEYNSALPSKEQLTDWANKLNFMMAAECASIPNIEIENIGNVKARDINVTLTMPDIVTVMYKDKYDELETPKNIMPVSPVEKAEKQFASRRTVGVRLGHSFYDGPDLSGLRVKTRDFYQSNVSINHSLLLRDNVIKIQLKSLMHTCNKIFEDKLAFIPVAVGKGEIEISIICEEFREPTMFKVPIEVIEKEESDTP